MWRLAAAVGDDDLGRLVRARLAEAGVGVAALQPSTLPTGLSVHLLREDGDRGILTRWARSTDLDVDAAMAPAHTARHLHLTSLYLIPALHARGGELLGRGGHGERGHQLRPVGRLRGAGLAARRRRAAAQRDRGARADRRGRRRGRRPRAGRPRRDGRGQARRRGRPGRRGRGRRRRRGRARRRAAGPGPGGRHRRRRRRLRRRLPVRAPRRRPAARRAAPGVRRRHALSVRARGERGQPTLAEARALAAAAS